MRGFYSVGKGGFLPRSNGKRWKNKEDMYATGWDDGCDGEGSNDSAAGDRRDNILAWVYVFGLGA